MTRVFVSAAGNRGMRVAQLLEVAGFEVPMGDTHNGFENAELLEVALRSSHCVVLVADEAAKSVGVGIELAIARDAKVPVIVLTQTKPEWLSFWWSWNLFFFHPPDEHLNNFIEQVGCWRKNNRVPRAHRWPPAPLSLR